MTGTLTRLMARALPMPRSGAMRRPPGVGLIESCLPRALAAAMTVAAMTIAAAIETPVLTNRKVGLFAFGSLPFRPRKRRTDQRTMHGPLVVGVVTGLVGGWWRDDLVDVGRSSERFGGKIEALLDHGRIGRHERVDCDRAGRHSVRRSGDERARGFLSSWRWNLGLLVFMLGVARGAACLLHFVVDHGDHRMIGDAALARTVVVKNVTEPNPALLHKYPGAFISRRAPRRTTGPASPSTGGVGEIGEGV